MKKLGMLMFYLFILTSLFACESSKGDLMEKLIEYQQKVDSIMSTEESSVMQIASIDAYDFPSLDDPFMVPKETYMAIYNQQRMNFFDVKLDYVLMQYKDLLDELIVKLEKQELTSLSTEVELDYREMMGLRADVELLRDGSVVIKLSLNFFNVRYYSGIKLGYEEEDFYLRELTQFQSESYYEYFEFYENHNMINLRYSPEAYWYRYQNQNDHTYYEISEDRYYGDSNFALCWYNPETNIRTIMARGESRFNQIEFFNEKDSYFIFNENLDTQKVSLSWQLLEALGWEYVYHQENHVNPYNGIYAQGTKLFPDARTNIDLNPMFANVRITMQVDLTEVTNEMIQLSLYGLTFNYSELTIENILAIKERALEDSAHLSKYHGIDFLNDDLSLVLYGVIDDAIKP